MAQVTGPETHVSRLERTNTQVALVPHVLSVSWNVSDEGKVELMKHAQFKFLDGELLPAVTGHFVLGSGGL